MKVSTPAVLAELVALGLSAWQPGTKASAAPITPVKVAEMPFASLQQFNSLRLQGNYLYTTGLGFQIFDISNRTNPVNIATIGLSYGGGSLSVSGKYAYVLEGNSSYGGALHVFDVSTPAHPTQVTQFSGGYCISVFGQYAFLDSTIYDISNPANPLELGQLPGVGPVDWTGNFVSVAGNYAYVAQNGTGLVVFDITDPSHAVQVGQASSGLYAWEVVLNGNYAYIAAATNCGLAAFNISNPTNPVALPCWIPGAQRVTVSGNFAFLDWAGLTILDISNPTNMVVVADDESYGTYALRIAVTGNYAYVAGVAQGTGQPSLGVYRLDVPAPPLGISTTQTNSVVLTWPAPTIAFAVQQTHDLNSNNWVTLTNTPDLVASMNQIVLPAPPQNTFYRLTVSGP